MKLSNVQQRFILHWGEMGTRWGINRTVAQIHALLYISPKPLNAEEIAETLDVARSNVSNSLRELQGWGIIKLIHQIGDRRDHYESMADVWEMFRIILNERKRREIDPSLVALRECIQELNEGKEKDPFTLKRLENLSEFMDTTSGWYERLKNLPTSSLKRLFSMGEKLASFIGKDRG